jgi:hypothetical protein
MASPRDVFKKYYPARVDQNLLPPSDLDFPPTGERYNILAVCGIMPILDSPFRKAEKLSLRNPDCLRRFCFAVHRRRRESDFHSVLVGLPVRTSVETGDHDGRTLLAGNVCTHNYSDATEKDRLNYPARE